MADAPPTLAAALKNVQDATTFINNLPFTRSNRLSAAALASEAQFEQLYLRDAEDHEIALFRSEPNENRYDPVDQATMDPRLDSRWTATKRIGPRRVGVLDKASPLKERNPDRTDDPARCLRAARKLLDVHSLPRSKATVERLQEELDTLEDSIALLEDGLKHPLPRSVDSALDEQARRVEQLEEDIKRDEMEIFALQEIQPERQKEVDDLRLMLRRRKMKPVPVVASAPFAKSDRTKAAASPLASPVASTSRQPISPSTPRPAVRASPVRVTPAKAAASPAPSVTPKVRIAATPKKPVRPDGVTAEDLEKMTTLIWSRDPVADFLRPWARKTLLEADKPIPSPLVSLPFQDTLQTLVTILAAPPAVADDKAVSVASSIYASTTDDAEDSNPSAPTPVLAIEAQLLHLLLTTYSLFPATSPVTLPVTFRDVISPLVTTIHKEPMLVFLDVKATLGVFAQSRGWESALGTTAFYSLVSKKLFRVDRRGKPCVAWNWVV